MAEDTMSYGEYEEQYGDVGCPDCGQDPCICPAHADACLSCKEAALLARLRVAVQKRYGIPLEDLILQKLREGLSRDEFREQMRSIFKKRKRCKK